ncbi:MAG: glycosyltransferase involved in cell wall biosynthesis [Mariniblastus sp.]|jgi:glycosyltransferase involved in cell wall biosynthesis
MRLFGKSRKQKKTSGPQRSRVVFVSHEATRTGAPKIILNLLKHFNLTCDIQCETVLQSGGHLASEFGEHSTVDCFNVPNHHTEGIRKRIGRLVNREKNNLPILAVCNSMESRESAAALAQLGIPCISLVHELPSSYTVDDYKMVLAASQKIVFPAHTVRDAANEKTPLPEGKTMVLPQGLLDPEFGQRIPQAVARKQVRQELGLPEDAFIVLGCGTLDLRKGIDHYAAVARHVAATNQSGRPIHFVWVGDGPRWCHSTYHYVKLDMEKSEARDRIHFIGERPQVESYFTGSDAFLLTSRVDPFPCVIHEAMATRLPIITFANSGGAVEALDNGAGVIVPYADYGQAANAIQALVDEPKHAQSILETSYQRVHSMYRFEDYADKLIDLSESVIGQRLRHATRPHIQPLAQPVVPPLIRAA